MKKFLKLKLIFALVAVAMLFAIASTLEMKVPAMASTPCGQVLINASKWLGGQGVDVHFNGVYMNTGNECNPDGEVYNLNANPPQYGFGWVCVELVNRLYVTRGWSTRLTIPATYNGQATNYGAKWLYTLAAAGYYPNLVAHANGSNYKSVPGDMIVHSNGTYGHVTVVDHISGNTLYAVDQNRSANGWESYTYNSSTGAVSMSGVTISGYVHSTKNTITPSPPPPPSFSGVGTYTFLGSGQLNAGQTMQGGQYLASGNLVYALLMQTDGNLVLYGGGTALWGSGTNGNPGAHAILQGDGNLVIYSSSGQPLWGSGTNGQSTANLIVQSDGNVVLNNKSGVPVWGTGTGGHANYTYFGFDRLAQGQQLPSGNYIVSADKRYALLMQTDGNLVVYSAGYHPLWGSGTNGNSGAYFLLQNDGNMVIYSSSNNALWGSNTVGQSLSYLVMQTDGNLVAYTASNAPIWATNTRGKI